MVADVQPKSEPIKVYCVFESGLSEKVMFAFVLAALAVTLLAAVVGSQV